MHMIGNCYTKTSTQHHHATANSRRNICWIENVEPEKFNANTWLRLIEQDVKFVWKQLKVVLNSVSITINSLSTIALKVMMQYGLQRKIQRIPNAEMVNCENSSIIFRCNRRVTTNFWEQGKFAEIRAQILHSSERLNYIHTLLAFLKNNYLYQIKIISADIQAGVYNSMINRIPTGFNIFARKYEDVMILFLHYILSLRGYQIVVIMNLNIYCF